MILVIDNRDSFTWNLVQFLRELEQVVLVERAEELDSGRVRELAPTRLLIGPGPGSPESATASLEVVTNLREELPILGVCLGMQVIALSFGSLITRAAEPVHGHANQLTHDGRGLFRGLPSPLTVGRYHSLIVDQAESTTNLEISARADDGTIMGLRHPHLPIEAVQFHPESVLSEHGHALLKNFCEMR